jgi:CheY-like chemotaxis protein/anti-sigma regulatory factor (Ser/Thr protein kinase)
MVSKRPLRIMVVEDDPTSREYLRRALEKNGCEVAAADGADAAERLFAEHADNWFDTVLTDYSMPGRNGLELLTAIKQKDACLATIILTGESERSLVAQSLRAGAADFLDKPVNIQKLLPALTRAVATTQRLRQLAETEAAVQSLARSQKSLLNTRAITLPNGGTASVDVCFHPKQDAGGDFFAHFQPKPERLVCLLTDVSGHDLRAAFVSAYFQGLVRGMEQCGQPMPEIFKAFNRFLIEEWNRPGQFRWQGDKVETSVAALSVAVDFSHHTATVLTSGTPAPIHIGADGRAQRVGTAGGAPLGWFEKLEVETLTFSTANTGSILLWTDGLEDLAEQLEVHPLCAAHLLETARQRGEILPQLHAAKNDVMFASIRLPHNPAVAGFFSPLLLDEYHGAQAGEIDALVQRWARHLVLAIPGITEVEQHDILLAAREAVLNAMKHGCGGDADKRIRFQISFHPASAAVKVWIEDPGPGHQFDFAAYETDAAEKILDEHRGLIFMLHLAHAVNFERSGATVILEFRLNQPTRL